MLMKAPAFAGVPNALNTQAEISARLELNRVRFLSDAEAGWERSRYAPDL
jgi:hypothetical protein